MWLTDTFINVGRTPITVTECKFGPCPKCRCMGVVPDGEYSALGVNIFDVDEFKLVAASLLGLRESILAGATVSQVKASIDGDKRLRNYLGKFVPQSIEDLIKLATLIGILFAATKAFDDDPKESIAAPQNVVNVINVIEPPDSHTSEEPGKDH